MPTKPRQAITSYDSLYHQAVESLDIFAKNMTNFVEDLRKSDPEKFGNLEIAAIKKPHKAIANIQGKHRGDVTLLCDLVRGLMIVDAEHMDELVDRMYKYFDVVGSKNRIANPNEYGFRDRKLNIALDNGHVCEMQCHISEIVAVKDLTHAAREKVNAIETLAFSENREISESEADTIERLEKFCLGLHNRAAKSARLNDQLDESLSKGRRIILGVEAFPVVDFAKVSPDNNKSLDKDLPIKFNGQWTLETQEAELL